MYARTLVDVYSCTCDKCGHVWRSEELSARCPKCKAPGWNKEVRTQVQVENYPPEPEIPDDVAAEFIEEDAPIVKQSLANVTPIVKERTRTPFPKRKEKKAKPAGKSGFCPHKFIRLDDGTTACPDCKRLASD